MTSKYYFRSLALGELGIQCDQKVIDLRDYITERFSNLTILSEILIFTNYGKLPDESIFEYQSEGEYIILNYLNFGSELVNYFEISDDEINLILIPYINNALNIIVRKVYLINVI